MWLVVELYGPDGLQHHVSLILSEYTLSEHVVQMQATFSHLLQTSTDIEGIGSEHLLNTLVKVSSSLLLYGLDTLANM